jgi:acyl-CoA synthetase (NDP forming)
MSTSLDALLNPGAVAIIGASNAPGRIGGRPINILITSGFKGKI